MTNFIFKMGSCYIAQSGPELLGLSDSLALTFQVAGTTGAEAIKNK
jgi:hypothetical protein